MAARLSGQPSFIIEPKSWDIDGLDYGALELSADTVNVSMAGVATQVTLAALLTELQLKADLTETQPISVASLPLPASAATQATLASALTELQSILTKLNASLAVTGAFYQATQPISAVSLPTHGVTGPLTDTELRAADVKMSLDGEQVAISNYPATQPVSIASMPSTPVTGPLTDAQLRAAAVPMSAASLPLPTGAALEAGNLATLVAKDYATQATLALIKAKTDNLDAALSGFSTLKAATPTQSTVSVLITNTAILAANANRRGATIYTESGATCFVKLGATASLTSYTAQVAIGGYYEVPYGYTGAIEGITVAITAVVRVTEFT